MKSLQALNILTEQLREINKTIQSIEWTRAEIDNTLAGIHIAKIEDNLSNAIGRTQTLIQHLRRINFLE